jgi:hypothetical protein
VAPFRSDVPYEGVRTMVQFWIQFTLVLGAILIGTRRGSVALGMLEGLEIAVLTIGFHNPPASPPVDVILIILAVVTASATLQVAGGLDWMVQRTERLLRTHPKRINILASLSTFFLTICVGTCPKAGRPRLPAPFRAPTGRNAQHRGFRRQCDTAGRRGVT